MRSCFVYFVAAMSAATASAAGTPSGKLMDKQEIKVCLDLNARVERQVDAYNAQVRGNNALLAKINAGKSELEGLQLLLDPNDPESETTYNGKVNALNAKIEEHNAREQKLVELGREGKRLSDTFDARCAGRRYLQDDMVEAGIETGAPVPRTKSRK